jgi:ectoine hydroxylase-related dioxygenase (phytanoyl-CoA dioxygenase family)
VLSIHMRTDITANDVHVQMALHSDQSLVFPEPWSKVWATNIIWCLTDVNEANGATRYIPGSNKWTARDQIPADAPAHLVPFEANAGDILVMDGRVWVSMQPPRYVITNASESRLTCTSSTTAHQRP